MKMEKFFPGPALAPFIREFIIIESSLAASSRTIPDTSIVMSFRYAGNVQRLDQDRHEALPPAVITGLRKSFRQFSYARHTANLLVVFHEGGINAFTAVPPNELFGLTIPSENLFNNAMLNELLERLAAAAGNRQRVNIVEAFFLEKLRGHKPDQLVQHAMQRIRQQQGIVKIRELAASLYISQDPFEKRFRAQVGATPKQYASIVRLRSLISKYPSLSSLTAASYEAGYYDQSHFIKDFRLFTGQAPGEFFKSPLFW